MVTKTKMRTIYIGYDKAEEIAYHTLVASIMEHASRPVAIVPLILRQLKNECYFRKHDPLQTNEFTYTRFLAPHLSNYEGISLFMDCDMIVRSDIHELFDLIEDTDFDVMCVQHPDYESKVRTKWHDKPQANYPRKNWSSVMLFNNALCKDLTHEYVNMASPANLHRMAWAKNIGALPKEWNHLVGEQPENSDAKIVHYTLGTPCWPRWRDCEFGDEWVSYRNMVNWYLPEDLEETG